LHFKASVEFPSADASVPNNCEACSSCSLSAFTCQLSPVESEDGEMLPMILSKNVPDFGVIGVATGGGSETLAADDCGMATDGAAVVAATEDGGIAMDGATEVAAVEGCGLAAGGG
jgi:hypothetical protein